MENRKRSEELLKEETGISKWMFRILALALNLIAVFLSVWAIMIMDEDHYVSSSLVTVVSLMVPIVAVLFYLRYPQYLKVDGRRGGGIGNLSLAVYVPPLLAFLVIWPVIPEGILSVLEMALALALGSASAVLTVLVLKIPKWLVDKVSFLLLSYFFAFSLVFHLFELI